MIGQGLPLVASPDEITVFAEGSRALREQCGQGKATSKAKQEKSECERGELEKGRRDEGGPKGGESERSEEGRGKERRGEREKKSEKEKKEEEKRTSHASGLSVRSEKEKKKKQKNKKKKKKSPYCRRFLFCFFGFSVCLSLCWWRCVSCAPL
jgi:hypothetical protein